eukprot:TRINITY_DN7204_c0_g1_i1.p1 TRINITY_DN7204_c0_g1~~TRINITY_DN7204_c0_g1_i1.p1  ORF type:complete len:265 (+),score=55.57 TRINITY_DN7204_c0_g1_i1:53-847(+)
MESEYEGTPLRVEKERSFVLERVQQMVADRSAAEFQRAVRIVFNSAPYYEATGAAQREAIRRCMAYVSQDGEFLLKGYAVTSLNEWAVEQERILLVSDRAYYRIKYEYASHSVVRCRRTPLSDIVEIQYGHFAPAPRSVSARAMADSLRNQHGFRIITAARDGRANINDYLRKKLAVQTTGYRREYRPFTADQLQEKAVTEEIMVLFSLLSGFSDPNKDFVELAKEKTLFPMVEMPLEIEIAGGLVSVVCNSMQVGLWNPPEDS